MYRSGHSYCGDKMRFFLGVLVYGLLDTWKRLQKCFAACVRFEIVVRERQDICFRKVDCRHVWKGLHECRIACDHDETKVPAIIKYPWIALGLLVLIVVDSDIQPRFSQLFSEEDRP
jgi:hypothetical protein